MEYLPILNSKGEFFQQDPLAFLEFAIKTTEGSSAYRNDRERPYDGQPWTDNGIRGSQIVTGLTMRDLKDCLIQAFLDSAPPELNLREKADNGSWSTDDCYGWDLDKMDPICLTQNFTCRVEKMMGIFPNLKGCPSTEEIIQALENSGETIG